jgi:excisionase family DNA binding protein
MNDTNTEFVLALSVDEAATALRLSSKTVRKLIQAGELPACRLGRRIVITVDSLKTYLRAHERGDIGG